MTRSGWLGSWQHEGSPEGDPSATLSNGVPLRLPQIPEAMSP
jgi:hypothetical protein